MSMTIVIWKKRDSSIYYRLVRGYYAKYEVGYKNQYGHEVISVLPNVYQYVPKLSFKEKCKKRFIRYLQKL